MNAKRCGISNVQWTDYLDQSLSARGQQEIESHLRVCASCSLEFAALRQVDQQLRIECGVLLQSFQQGGLPETPSGERILAILRDGAMAANPKGIQERLWQVLWVLAMLCGPHTATRLIGAAESHANIPPNTRPTEQKWPPFLHRLSYLTTEICGCQAGELIRVVGQ
jgi:hypothetical protein